MKTRKGIIHENNKKLIAYIDKNNIPDRTLRDELGFKNDSSFYSKIRTATWTIPQINIILDFLDRELGGTHRYEDFFR